MEYRNVQQKSKNKQDPYHTDATENLLCTSSATDCTGLIPAGITDDELDAYEQLYPYLPVLSGNTVDRDHQNKESI
ncbi:MAG TPA: hypothetical protein DF613_09425 [Lachnospiraceae bacterium]|nr:hypothetical protein [Lachnospiraceae bacterium]